MSRSTPPTLQELLKGNTNNGSVDVNGQITMARRPSLAELVAKVEEARALEQESGAQAGNQRRKLDAARVERRNLQEQRKRAPSRGAEVEELAKLDARLADASRHIEIAAAEGDRLEQVGARAHNARLLAEDAVRRAQARVTALPSRIHEIAGLIRRDGFEIAELERRATDLRGGQAQRKREREALEAELIQLVGEERASVLLGRGMPR